MIAMLSALLCLMALLAGARPAAGRDSTGAPAGALEHDFRVLALDELSALTEPWLPPSKAPALALGLNAVSNTTSLQAQDPEATMAKRLRGCGMFGPNIPNELQVFFQNGLSWYYTWECAPARRTAFGRWRLRSVLDAVLTSVCTSVYGLLSY